ncbi:hypothetical protein CB1_001562003 [Camelus ferus]|nr:hypothetical protein CB1_001562003 [Camelus ferus]
MLSAPWTAVTASGPTAGDLLGEVTCGVCLEHAPDPVSLFCGHRPASPGAASLSGSLKKPCAVPSESNHLKRGPRAQLDSGPEQSCSHSSPHPPPARVTVEKEMLSAPWTAVTRVTVEKEMLSAPWTAVTASGPTAGDLLGEVTCRVCLEHAPDPVSLFCGHSSCQAGVTGCRVTFRSTEEALCCPFCKQPFQEGTSGPTGFWPVWSPAS